MKSAGATQCLTSMTMRCSSDITEGSPPTEISDSMPKYSASSSSVTNTASQPASQPTGPREVERGGGRERQHDEQRDAAQAHRDEKAQHHGDRPGLAHERPSELDRGGDEQPRARGADARDRRPDDGVRSVIGVKGGEREHPNERQREQAEEGDHRAAQAEPALAEHDRRVADVGARQELAE